MSDNKIRIYGDISPDHEAEFLFIKGALGCKNNGEALEKVIDAISPQVRKAAASRSGAGRGR